jgi:hypothetical protein
MAYKYNLRIRLIIRNIFIRKYFKFVFDKPKKHKTMWNKIQ